MIEQDHESARCRYYNQWSVILNFGLIDITRVQQRSTLTTPTTLNFQLDKALAAKNVDWRCARAIRTL